MLERAGDFRASVPIAQETADKAAVIRERHYIRYIF
jgi:hypothetical protein